MDAVVLGAGVSGLTTALCLLRAGWTVAMWAADPPEATTSAVAAAIWYPYRASPADRVVAWGRRSLEVFTALSSHPATGVVWREGVELFRARAGEPWWRDAVETVAHCAPEELPPGYADGWVFRVPIIEMPTYLAWLNEQFRAAGGTFERRRVTSLAEATEVCGLVVNCTGLAAGELADDLSLYPVRGQVVLVRNPGLERFLIDEAHPEGVTYVVPRSGDCVLGGAADEGVWDAEPDPALADAILRRCVALEPRLAGAEVLGHKAGLRPARPTIRIEAERLDDGWCVHNYGHGGAGVTLSWGCAEEAAELAAGLGDELPA
jgi:D-amino-acid oxidase